MTMNERLQFDRDHIWHPYTSMTDPLPVYCVEQCHDVMIKLHDPDVEVIDGMSSWWCMIHGYNHPVLNRAVTEQLNKMAHVMFGGLTHQPAIELAEKLVELTPEGLNKVFFADSGSVSVEVALKMAIQYWQATGNPARHRFMTIRSGYHGDTFGAMSVCDPVSGMHHLFKDVMPAHVFAAAPQCNYGDRWDDTCFADFKEQFVRHAEELAAVILEPVVQGAGGMRFYAVDFLRHVRELCNEYNVLLIFDEIATGFGRTGELFAADLANVAPDIICLGKALTGGYLSFAATLTTDEVAQGICRDGGVFMHGPTFMGNPLACSVANASIKLLLESDWRTKIAAIETRLKEGLAPCLESERVADVRCLGAIGVVEMKYPVNVAQTQQALVDRGVWLRPFGKLIYTMPPYIIQPQQLQTITDAICQIIKTDCVTA